MRRSPLVLAAVMIAALLAGCGGGSPAPPSAPSVDRNDINAKPRELVRDGGELRLPITALPDNFNLNQFAGSQADTEAIAHAVLPFPFPGTADGGLRLDADYLTSAGVTSTAPLVITYTINPLATWSDRTPITWRDFEAQWKALSGTDPAYQIASASGYEDIASVTRGADDRQAVVTFARPFAEWKGLFSPLYPASTNGDAAVFNTGWRGRLPVTAGPFEVESIDPAARTVTLRRSPAWWGRPAKLDRVVFKVYEPAALADAMAANQIDFYKIGSSVDLLKRAQSIPGVAVRQSPERAYNHLTFNGAPGAVLADVRLRRAVAKGIDRTAVAKRLVGQITPDVVALGNHIYPVGSRYYRDNSDEVAYDQAEADRELTDLGWVRPGPGATRVKDGRELRVRLMEPVPSPIGEQIDRAVAEQLGQLGVAAVIEPVPVALAASRYKAGDFDLVSFAWQGTPTPFGSSGGLFAEPKGDDVRQNYGRIYDPEITALFEQGLRELDDDRRAEIANQADRLIWREVHHLPLYPSTGAVAVRSTLANFGAPGYADVNYLDAGYLK